VTLAITRTFSWWLVLAIAELVLSSECVRAESGSTDHPPTEIVRRYVTLDQKGARLDARSFETLRPYIDWRQEPAWGRLVVIQEVAVPEDYRQWEVINKLEVIIPVTYRVLGFVYLDTAAFVPESEAMVEEVRFHVKAIENKWRIIEPVIPPHVGLKRMLNFVREALLQETDGENKSALVALEDSLRKAK
jgi:hypothetical protein